MHRTEERDFEEFRQSGDPAALARVFDRTAPKLLLLAGHWTQDAAAAEDLVQMVFLHAMRDAAQWRVGESLLRWLAGILAHRALDQRKYAARRAHLEIEDGVGREATPLQYAMDRESLDLISAAIDGLDAPYRDVLVLRCIHGLDAPAIAHALGRSPATVRKQIERGLQRLRGILPPSLAVLPFGSLRAGRGIAELRQALFAELSPAAVVPRFSPASAWAWGALGMQKTMGLACLLAAALIWWTWPPTVTEPVPARLADAADAPAIMDRSSLHQREDVRTMAQEELEAQMESERIEQDAFGALRVTVHYGDEPAEEGVVLALRGVDRGAPFDWHYQRTTPGGFARFEGLRGGAFEVWATRRPSLRRYVEVIAGAETECALKLAGGMNLMGRVVDERGVGIAGALLEGSLGGDRRVHAEPLTQTTEDGSFHLRECDSIVLIGARAAGFASTPLQFLIGAPGSTQQVQIELLRPGGIVEGRIFDAEGAPIAKAIVRVGSGRLTDLVSTPQGTPPLPAQGESDELGAFLLVGIAAGAQPVEVCARGRASWRGTCEVSEYGTHSLMIRLGAGRRIEGRVLDEQGNAVAGALVQVGERGTLSYRQTHSDRNGDFALDDMPEEATRVQAEKDPLGSAELLVAPHAEQAGRCALHLSNGVCFEGTVVEATSGAALKGIRVSLYRDDAAGDWMRSEKTDHVGRFRFTHCPEHTSFRVEIHAPQFVPLKQSGLNAGVEQRFALEPDTAPRARITGVILRPDGRPAHRESVDAHCVEPRQNQSAMIEEDGSFTIEGAAGAWDLRVLIEGYPELRVPTQQIAAGQTWHVGTLQLTVGGTLRIETSTKDAALEANVLDSNDRWVARIYTPMPPLRSDLLAPGLYSLLVRGSEVAAQRVAFQIRAGAETRLDLELRRGTRQRVSIERSSLQTSTRFELELHRANQLVQSQVITLKQERVEFPLWLEPDTYQLRWRSGAAVGHHELRVLDVEGQVLLIEVP